MKKYIIITMSICGIGGAVQYVFNKSRYLEENGYKVYVFSSMNDSILISELKKYRKYIIPNLMYPVNCFKKSDIERVIKEELNYVSAKEEDSFFIESTSLFAAEWGELLAERLKCRNLIFNLQEKHEYTDSERRFLKFKYEEDELYGISESSVRLMLNDETMPDTSRYTISAKCNNVVEDVEDNISRLLDKTANSTFASIGRLEKECVKPMLLSIMHYVSARPEKRFNLVLIGGANQKAVINDIKKIFSTVDNIKLIITGYLYPIPRRLLQEVDLFISTAGSAYVTYIEKRPTIKIHPYNGLPNGVYGSEKYPVGNLYDNIKGVCLEQIIDEILKGKISIEYEDGDASKLYVDDMRKEFSRQVLLFENKGTDYYNVISVSNSYLKYKLYRLLGMMIGGNGLQHLLSLYRKMIK